MMDLMSPGAEVVTEVREERGRWVVDIVVLTDDGVERRRLGDHATQRQAVLAADVVRRTVARRRPPSPDDWNESR